MWVNWNTMREEYERNNIIRKRQNKFERKWSKNHDISRAQGSQILVDEEVDNRKLYQVIKGRNESRQKDCWTIEATPRDSFKDLFSTKSILVVFSTFSQFEAIVGVNNTTYPKCQVPTHPFIAFDGVLICTPPMYFHEWAGIR